MIGLNYRLDFVGLSTENKPATTELKNGSTYYTVDTHELFIYYKGEWYNQNEEVTPNEETPNDSRGSDLRGVISNEET